MYVCMYACMQVRIYLWRNEKYAAQQCIVCINSQQNDRKPWCSWSIAGPSLCWSLTRSPTVNNTNPSGSHQHVKLLYIQNIHKCLHTFSYLLLRMSNKRFKQLKRSKDFCYLLCLLHTHLQSARNIRWLFSRSVLFVISGLYLVPYRENATWYLKCKRSTNSQVEPHRKRGVFPLEQPIGEWCKLNNSCVL